MANRVASNAGAARVGADLARAFDRMAKVQGQITSGKRLQKPSDDPSQVSTALETRSAQRRLEQYAANATDALGWLRVSDTTLMSLQERATEARTKAVAAVNGSLDATGLKALANDIRNIRDAMVQLGNATYQGRPIFGGTAGIDVQPFEADGTTAAIEYKGDDGRVLRAIDDGVELQINMTGPQVFGTRSGDPANPGDVFETLDALISAAESGDAGALSAASDFLSQRVEVMAEAQIRIGGASQQIEGALARNELVREDVRSRLSTIEDTDLAESIIALRSNEAAYEAALGVTARVIQPTLLDFLR